MTETQIAQHTADITLIRNSRGQVATPDAIDAYLLAKDPDTVIDGGPERDADAAGLA